MLVHVLACPVGGTIIDHQDIGAVLAYGMQDVIDVVDFVVDWKSGEETGGHGGRNPGRVIPVAILGL
jgi:hypothetical protein